MRTVLEVDGLFDGIRTMSDATIVMEDAGEGAPGRGATVTWVGKRSRAPKTPKGEQSRTVEAAASFALPGMINCHAHLTFDGTKDFEAESRQTAAMATIKAVRNARASLAAGVTTVRDLGANGTMVVELARAIEQGVVEGPRILAAGRGITVTGGHGMEVGRICDSADEIRKGIREQVLAGAGVIKLFSTGGVLGGGAGAGPSVSQFSAEETRAAVAEARKLGVRITTHAHGAEGMRIAAQCGIDSIEHCTMLDAPTIKVVKENDVALVPTFSALHGILDHAAELPATTVERARAAAERHHEGVRAAHRAGVRIAAGTDAGTPFNRHEQYARELRYLTDVGLTKTEALVAATSRAADVIGRPKAGRIAQGMWADLVFLDGDPTRDLDVLLAPKAVWVRGAPIGGVGRAAG
ncbi:MAG TPA: amidohydrolase family protein [Candidatus Limnocylindria bacterium]|nr:amidohydrolase family protein [Candidatus Limnocylindria bacterium]